MPDGLPTGRGRKDDALGWFSLALGDLAAARSQSDGHVQPRIAAFHANQAAGKALEAALVMSGIEPPRTGDLDELRRALPVGWRTKRAHGDVAWLSHFGPDIAYPGNRTLTSLIESAEAIRRATAIVGLVREDFERRGVSTDGLEPA